VASPDVLWALSLRGEVMRKFYDGNMDTHNKNSTLKETQHVC
jgi:hypothetical protein